MPREVEKSAKPLCVAWLRGPSSLLAFALTALAYTETHNFRPITVGVAATAPWMTPVLRRLPLHRVEFMPGDFAAVRASVLYHWRPTVEIVGLSAEQIGEWRTMAAPPTLMNCPLIRAGIFTTDVMRQLAKYGVGA